MPRKFSVNFPLSIKKIQSSLISSFITSRYEKFYYAIFYSNLCEKHKGSRHILHATHRFHSISISSNSNSFRSRFQEREKNSKIRFLFLLLDFFTTAKKKKKHSLHFIRRKTRFRSLYKKKKNKKSKRFSRFSEKTCSRAWLNFVVERQTNAKIKKGKKEKGEKTKRERKKRNKKIVVLQCCLKISFSKGEKKPPFFREKTVHAKCE